jgi:tripartite-type tricarboxylate transporter receptor subunit TctC
MPKPLTRRRALALSAAALAPPARLAAQDLPRQITLVSGFAAGGSQDLLARLLAEEFRRTLGVNAVVENRTGAAGTIAAKAVKTAAPDAGQILVANIVAMSLAPFSYKDLGYDPLADFLPIAKTTEYQAVMATGPATGAKNYAELIDWLKRNPDKANMGIPAAGSLPHLITLRLAEVTGLKFTMVAYRGGAPIAKDLTGGHLQMGISAPADFLSNHQAKTLTIVAASGTARHPSMADVPTWKELGIAGLEMNGWNGLFLPKGTSEALRQRFEAATLQALANPAVRDRLVAMGFQVTPAEGARLSAQIAAEMREWGPVVTKAIGSK